MIRDLKNVVFWYVAPYSPVETHRIREGRIDSIIIVTSETSDQQAE